MRGCTAGRTGEVGGGKQVGRRKEDWSLRRMEGCCPVWLLRYLCALFPQPPRPTVTPAA